MSAANAQTHTVYGELPDNAFNQGAPTGNVHRHDHGHGHVLSRTRAGEQVHSRSDRPGSAPRAVSAGRGGIVLDLAAARRLRRDVRHGCPHRQERGRHAGRGADPGTGLVAGGRAGCLEPFPRPADFAGGLHAAAGWLAADPRGPAPQRRSGARAFVSPDRAGSAAGREPGLHRTAGRAQAERADLRGADRACRTAGDVGRQRAAPTASCPSPPATTARRTRASTVLP